LATCEIDQLHTCPGSFASRLNKTLNERSKLTSVEIGIIIFHYLKALSALELESDLKEQILSETVPCYASHLVNSMNQCTHVINTYPTESASIFLVILDHLLELKQLLHRYDCSAERLAQLLLMHIQKNTLGDELLIFTLGFLHLDGKDDILAILPLSLKGQSERLKQCIAKIYIPGLLYKYGHDKSSPYEPLARLIEISACVSDDDVLILYKKENIMAAFQAPENKLSYLKNGFYLLTSNVSENMTRPLVLNLWDFKIENFQYFLYQATIESARWPEKRLSLRAKSKEQLEQLEKIYEFILKPFLPSLCEKKIILLRSQLEELFSQQKETQTEPSNDEPGPLHSKSVEFKSTQPQTEERVWQIHIEKTKHKKKIRKKKNVDDPQIFVSPTVAQTPQTVEKPLHEELNRLTEATQFKPQQWLLLGKRILASKDVDSLIQLYLSALLNRGEKSRIQLAEPIEKKGELLILTCQLFLLLSYPYFEALLPWLKILENLPETLPASLATSLFIHMSKLLQKLKEELLTSQIGAAALPIVKLLAKDGRHPSKEVKKFFFILLDLLHDRPKGEFQVFLLTKFGGHALGGLNNATLKLFAVAAFNETSKRKKSHFSSQVVDWMLEHQIFEEEDLTLATVLGRWFIQFTEQKDESVFSLLIKFFKTNNLASSFLNEIYPAACMAIQNVYRFNVRKACSLLLLAKRAIPEEKAIPLAQSLGVQAVYKKDRKLFRKLVHHFPFLIEDLTWLFQRNAQPILALWDTIHFLFELYHPQSEKSLFHFLCIALIKNFPALDDPTQQKGWASFGNEKILTLILGIGSKGLEKEATIRRIVLILLFRFFKEELAEKRKGKQKNDATLTLKRFPKEQKEIIAIASNPYLVEGAASGHELEKIYGMLPLILRREPGSKIDESIVALFNRFAELADKAPSAELIPFAEKLEKSLAATILHYQKTKQAEQPSFLPVRMLHYVSGLLSLAERDFVSQIRVSAAFELCQQVKFNPLNFGKDLLKLHNTLMHKWLIYLANNEPPRPLTNAFDLLLQQFLTMHLAEDEKIDFMNNLFETMRKRGGDYADRVAELLLELFRQKAFPTENMAIKVTNSHVAYLARAFDIADEIERKIICIRLAQILTGLSKCSYDFKKVKAYDYCRLLCDLILKTKDYRTLIYFSEFILSSSVFDKSQQIDLHFLMLKKGSPCEVRPYLMSVIVKLKTDASLIEGISPLEVKLLSLVSQLFSNNKAERENAKKTIVSLPGQTSVYCGLAAAGLYRANQVMNPPATCDDFIIQMRELLELGCVKPYLGTTVFRWFFSSLQASKAVFLLEKIKEPKFEKKANRMYIKLCALSLADRDLLIATQLLHFFRIKIFAIANFESDTSKLIGYFKQAYTSQLYSLTPRRLIEDVLIGLQILSDRDDEKGNWPHFEVAKKLFKFAKEEFSLSNEEIFFILTNWGADVPHPWMAEQVEMIAKVFMNACYSEKDILLLWKGQIKRLDMA
jgi:hypothetical protein